MKIVIAGFLLILIALVVAVLIQLDAVDTTLRLMDVAC